MISRGLYALLLATTLGTVASQLYVPPPLSEAAIQVEMAPHAVNVEGASSRDGLQRLPVGTHGDLFASQLPPPPPAVVAPPPPPPPPPEPPRAPPVPFEYMGRLEEDGVVSIFLKRGENPYSVKVGDTVDEVYQVVDLDEAGVHVVYLPLKQRQLIPRPR